MTLTQLYSYLQAAKTGNTLTLSPDTAESAYSRLLDSLSLEKLVITSCSVISNPDTIVLSGRAQILPFTSIGTGEFLLTSSLAGCRGNEPAGDRIVYQSRLSITGSGRLADFAGELPPSYTAASSERQNCLFSEFIIVNPVLLFSCEDEACPLTWSVTGLASCPDTEVRWNRYRMLLSPMMPFSGSIQAGIPHPFFPECNLDFSLDQILPFPLGKTAVVLGMRIVEGSTVIDDRYVTNAYLFYKLTLPSASRTARFQSRLFADEQYQSSAAFFDPPLSLGNIGEFMGTLFGIGGNGLLLPEDTLFSAFGLQELQMTLSLKGASLLEGMSVERIYSIFSLAHPISTPIPNLTLDEFRMVWEISWWGQPDSVITLFAVVKGTLVIGSCRLTGELTGYFPMMDFEGSFTLDKQMTLTELAEDCQVPIPQGWEGNSKEIASLDISASAKGRSLSLSGSVSDLITISIGGLSLTLTNLSVSAYLYPEGFDFGIQGTLSFTPKGYDSFSFRLSAGYLNSNWLFSGELASGKVNIGGLLLSLFQIEAGEAAAGVELDQFSISYSVNDAHFQLYASMSVFWFTVFGIRPSLGGKILLDQTDNKTEASLAFYLDVDAFRFLVQANDFYSEKDRSFLFRIEFMNKYIQAVYQKTDSADMVTITLGGLTLGDMVLELIHLINPNARQTLSAPWHILNEIKLSAFALTITKTGETLSAALTYHLNLNIPGLMQINDIGVAYSKEKGVEYILTGKLLEETYTMQDPLSWNALTGSPPANSATDETKFTLYYLGIGNHLDLSISEDTIPAILEEVKAQLTPVSGVPSVTYRGDAGWLFGIDFDLSDLFRVKVLLYSPKLYGGILTVAASSQSPLAMFNGLLLELYYKKISDSTGMFHCRLVVPKQFADINLGAIAIHLGQFLLEIYTNGSFYLDLGFPHNNDFSGSFGLSVGIFGGKGGFYFGVLTGDAVNSVPSVSNGVFTPVIKIGIGLSIGLVRSFDFGIVRGGVSLTMVGIFEGAFAIFRPTKKDRPEAFYYKARAVAGLSGSLFLTVDFKIIVISASAAVSAFCELVLESYQKAEAALTLDLKLSASIKILFIKISFSFHFHHRVSFTFGSASTPPWQLSGESRHEMRSLPPVLIEPVKHLGTWHITPSVIPLCSAADPIAASDPGYCIAFLMVINQEDLYAILSMLAKWVLSHTPGEAVTSLESEALIKADFGKALTYDDLVKLLSLNMTIAPVFEPEQPEETDEVRDAFVFPMLPQLILHINDQTIDFSEAVISEADMNVISEYFYQLNADPSYALSKNPPSNDLTPLSGAVLTDWFKMAVSEISGQLALLFSSLTVETTDLADTVLLYQADMEQVLTDNPDMILKVTSLPQFTHTVRSGDTLSSLQTQYQLSAEVLWESVKDSTYLLAQSVCVSLDGYCFDNTSVLLSAAEACAMFFVRLFDPDVLYVPYGDFLLASNSLTMDWICSTKGEPSLLLPQGSYLPSCGDTVVRIAKMLYLLNNEYDASAWRSFQSEFYIKNTVKPTDRADSYLLFGSYTLQEYSTPAHLFTTCYPDFALPSSEGYSLWQADILRPMAVISFDHASVSDSGSVSALLQKYDMHVISLACQQKTALLSEAHSLLLTRPGLISKQELEAHMLTAERLAETGSQLSRGFLQGACPPAPVTHKETPLYELLKQQLPLTNLSQDYQLSLERNDPEAHWIIPPADKAVLSASQLRNLLPEGSLDKPPLPSPAQDLHCQPKCWSLGKGLTVLNKDPAEMIFPLPGDCIRYLQSHQSLPEVRLDNNSFSDFQWCSIIPVTIAKKGKGVYYLQGAAADDRSLLYALASAKVEACRLLYTPSRLEAESSELAELSTSHCCIIKTRLSKETHYKRYTYQNEENPYIASMEQPSAFLVLLWECSVIGGGFWLYYDGDPLPDTMFDDEGMAVLQLTASFQPQALPAGAINALLLPGTDGCVSLIGEQETVYTPVLPAGCTGLSLLRTFNQEDSLQSLYQLLAYRVHSGLLEADVESAPLLPEAASSDSLLYSIAVPLWKLCGPKDFVYSAIGKSFDLIFYLRDVLGNSVELGSVKVTGAYNDNLIALHELPATKINYLFLVKEGTVFIQITCSYAGEEQALRSVSDAAAGSDDSRTADRNTAAQSLAQLSCEDILLTGKTSLNDSVISIGEKAVLELRQYAAALCRNLDTGAATGIPSVIILLPVDKDLLPDQITPLTVTLTVKRSLAASPSPQICFADTLVLADEQAESFYKSFHAAFPDATARLAFNQSDELYYVPIEKLLGQVSIRPYSYRFGNRTLSSPEFVSLAPFSNGLITRKVPVTRYDGTKEDQTFVNVDANIWEKQLLSDIESLLSADMVCQAAKSCPDAVKLLVEAKKNVSAALSGRLLPVRKDNAQFPLEAVRNSAKDRLMGDLTLAYATDIIAVFQSSFSPARTIRLEPYMEAPHILSATKLSEQEEIFCLFLAEREQQEPGDLSAAISFPNIEYDIMTTPEGYDRSRWLRLETPVTSADSFAQIDLTSEADTPYPRKECPLPPTLPEQSFHASQQEFLYWDWEVQITCSAYEQYTVCLDICFEQESLQCAANSRTPFDILGDYNCKSEQLKEDLKKADTFQSAYQRITELAYEFSQCSLSKEKPLQTACSSAITIPVRISFTLGEEIRFTVQPDADRDALLEKLGASLNPVAYVSGKNKGENLTFRLSLSHLPVYECRSVTPAARIIQNDNLFGDTSQLIRQDFIFLTETVSLPCMKISADYPDLMSISGKTLAEAVNHLFNTLKLNETVSANMTVFYRHPIDTEFPSLVITTPVTYIPDATVSSVTENITDWYQQASLCTTSESCFYFEITVYEKNSDFMLIHARFQLRIQSGFLAVTLTHSP